jgi:hypothetical protein
MSVSNWSSSSSDGSGEDAPEWSVARLADEGVSYRVVCVQLTAFSTPCTGSMLTFSRFSALQERTR